MEPCAYIVAAMNAVKLVPISIYMKMKQWMNIARNNEPMICVNLLTNEKPGIYEVVTEVTIKYYDMDPGKARAPAAAWV